LVASKNFTTACLVHVPTEDINFFLPNGAGTTQTVKDALQLLQKHPREKIWITDSEGLGSTRQGLLATPTEFGIIILSDPQRQASGQVAYASHHTVYSIVQELKDPDAIRWKSIPRRFQTVAKLRGTIVEGLGFVDSEAIVVQWGRTKLDGDALRRILLEDDKVISERDESGLEFKMVDLLQIFRSCTNLGHPWSLSQVWTSFFPAEAEDLCDWRIAMFNASRTCDLLLKLMESLPRSMEELQED
ncbi:hypothetical protein CC86DRAFT_295241, partial [Ophiobolus disseminans]